MNRELWGMVVRAAGGRNYPRLEKYLKDAPPEVQEDIRLLLIHLADEARMEGRREAHKAMRSGRFF